MEGIGAPQLLPIHGARGRGRAPVPSYEDEGDVAVYVRDRWYYRLLRRHFNAVMKRLTGDDGFIDHMLNTKATLKTKAKPDCYELKPELIGIGRTTGSGPTKEPGEARMVPTGQGK